jgi:hypothetical protein
VLEGLSMAGLALGSIAAAELIAWLSEEEAVVATGLFLPALVVLLAGKLRRIDRAATVPIVEIALLRAVPIFASLSPPELEAAARRSSRSRPTPGRSSCGRESGRPLVRDRRRGGRGMSARGPAPAATVRCAGAGPRPRLLRISRRSSSRSSSRRCREPRPRSPPCPHCIRRRQGRGRRWLRSVGCRSLP